MLTIIILALLSALFVWLTTVSDKKNWADPIGIVFFVFGLVSAGTLVVLLFIIIPCRVSFKYEKAQYDIVKEMVEEYKDGGCGEGEFVGLADGVFEANRMVEKHKLFSSNPFFNIWYSKDLGKLEHLSLETGGGKQPRGGGE